MSKTIKELEDENAKLRAALNQWVFVMDGDDKFMGMWFTLDGYYEWDKQPEYLEVRRLTAEALEEKP